MDPNEHRDGAAPDPGQPMDRPLEQPHGDGRQDPGRAVADLAGEFGAELVRAIRTGLAQGPGSGYGPRGPPQLS